MKTTELIKTLEKINKPFYSLADLEKIMGLPRKSLYVSLKRLVDRGILVKIGVGMYRLFTTPVSAERVASALYLPNYLSFESALSRYGILNLVPYTITFATTRKTRRFTVEGRDAEFRQIKRALFWGYEMKGGIYVARPEKAFLDQIYLVVRGKASIDPDELNLKGLSIKRLRVYSKKFPGYVGRYIEKLVAYPISP